MIKSIKQFNNYLEKRFNLKEPWTMSNNITLTRIAVTPIIYFLILYQYWTAAFLFFIIFAFTDHIDGALARKTNTCTELGATLDALSDRIMIIVTAIALVSTGVPSYVFWLFMAILCLELFIGISYTSKFHKFYLSEVHRDTIRYTALFIYIWMSAWIFNFTKFEPFYSLDTLRYGLAGIVLLGTFISFADYSYYIFKQ